MRTNTVHFNVGGKKFEVSQDLIASHENTMLGRLVSDTWTSAASADEQDEPVFIDRDGDTFGLVLHYLRYGTVSLPMTVPRDNFLRDLDFYGIVAVEGTIDCASSSLQAARHMLLCEREHSQKLKEFDAKIHELQMRKRYTILAHECFLRHSKDGSMTFDFSPEHKMYEMARVGFGPLYLDLDGKYMDRYDEELFNEHLSEYGFTAVERPEAFYKDSKTHYQVKLKLKAAGGASEE